MSTLQTMVSREEWGAKPATTESSLTHPIHKILLRSTETERCLSKEDCIRVVQELQKQHVSQGLSDIKYNFLVGGDGNLYEGRGWDNKPAKSELYPGFQDSGIAIAFLGHKGIRPPKEETTISKQFVKSAVEKELVTQNPSLVELKVTRMDGFPEGFQPLEIRDIHDYSKVRQLEDEDPTPEYPDLLGLTWPVDLEHDNYKSPKLAKSLPQFAVRRDQWYAVPPRVIDFGVDHPVTDILLTYTGTDQCTTMDSCMEIVKNLQIEHMRELPDIKQNFLVGNDGHCYVGRGWVSNPALTDQFKDKLGSIINIAYIGNKDQPYTPEQTDMMKELIKLGQENELVESNPTFHEDL